MNNDWKCAISKKHSPSEETSPEGAGITQFLHTLPRHDLQEITKGFEFSGRIFLIHSNKAVIEIIVEESDLQELSRGEEPSRGAQRGSSLWQLHMEWKSKELTLRLSVLPWLLGQLLDSFDDRLPVASVHQNFPLDSLSYGCSYCGSSL